MYTYQELVEMEQLKVEVRKGIINKAKIQRLKNSFHLHNPISFHKVFSQMMCLLYSLYELCKVSIIYQHFKKIDSI